MDSDDAAFEERVVYPGEFVTAEIESLAADGGGMVKLGAGLAPVEDDVVTTRAGILSHKEPARFFVLSNHKRYYAAVGDTVVGVISDRNAEFYRVRLHGTIMAILPVLAFDGATKRNKPNLAIGALVFARVVSVSKYMDTELTCQGEQCVDIGSAVTSTQSAAAHLVIAHPHSTLPLCSRWRSQKRLDDWAKRVW
jgi:exosome complex component RRP40